ncbi:putative fibroblast growth factor 1 [Hoplias malabaricus]|uniref:putative fibroblast growth factor 1 n=1 Tax=Hoplias malabaricus TaxID=27720 RepID=UPI003462C03B
MEAEIPQLSEQTELFHLKSADYTKLVLLYCMNGGHHLSLLQDGGVEGTRDQHESHCILRIKAVSPGVVVIEGVEAGQFLSMSEHGKLYGSLSVTDESYFLEKIEENHYNTYSSQKHGPNWYVGIKKNGKPKNGSRTHIGQKAIFFLPRQLDRAKDEGLTLANE